MPDEGNIQQTTGDLTGQTLGQYTIGDMLGQGGMATVYRAKQSSIGRTVAIKVMPMFFMHEPTFMQRFEREVQVIAELQHPRVLPVYDYGQIEGRPFIVMAYMPGGTLTDLIKQGPMPLDETVRLMEQIAEGLDHAHRKGVIHRDFKPSNVLLDENGNAYLSDFGIAKISESTVQLTGSGVVGTPAYMAPEMASYAEVTPAVDIYAMGVTLYQMLTGKLPYRGETPLSVMMAHASEPVPDVRRARPDLPEDVQSVIERAMSKDPKARYQTAAALARDLRRAAEAAGAVEPSKSRETMVAVAPPPAERTMPEPVTGPTAGGWQTSPQVHEAPYPGTMPPAKEKRGCNWGLYIGIGIGVLVLAGLCFGGLLAIGALGGPTPTPAPTATPTDTPRPTFPPTVTPPAVTATPVPGPADTAVPAGSTTDLIIQNSSSVQICFVFISAPEATTWGNDQLGTNDVIAPGGTYTIHNVPQGKQDFEAEDCSNNLLDEHFGVVLGPSPYAWQIFDKSATLTIINNSSTAVCKLFVSGVDDTAWNDNLLLQNTSIDPGQTYTLNVQPRMTDVRAEGCDTTTYWEDYSLDIQSTWEWTLTN